MIEGQGSRIVFHKRSAMISDEDENRGIVPRARSGRFKEASDAPIGIIVSLLKRSLKLLRYFVFPGGEAGSWVLIVWIR